MPKLALLCSQTARSRRKHFISTLENVDLNGLILSILGNCCRLLVFVLNVNFYKNTLSFIVRVLNVLDQDQTQYVLGSDLCPNCLQIIPA